MATKKKSNKALLLEVFHENDADVRHALRADMPPAWIWRAHLRGELSGEALEYMREFVVAFPEVTRIFLPQK